MESERSQVFIKEEVEEERNNCLVPGPFKEEDPLER
jgi:hypothetical protein